MVISLYYIIKSDSLRDNEFYLKYFYFWCLLYFDFSEHLVILNTVLIDFIYSLNVQHFLAVMYQHTELHVKHWGMWSLSLTVRSVIFQLTCLQLCDSMRDGVQAAFCFISRRLPFPFSFVSLSVFLNSTELCFLSALDLLPEHFHTLY